MDPWSKIDRNLSRAIRNVKIAVILVSLATLINIATAIIIMVVRD